MIRGSQTITSIFPTALKNQDSRKVSKGIYTQERDICLCYRYYYYYEISRIRIDDTIASMEKEFFVSAKTIMSRLLDYSDLLKDIVHNKPSKIELRKKYPQFVWS